MQRLTRSRLLRLREQRKVEQGDGFAKTLARPSDTMDLGNWNADGFAADLNDRLGECSHNSMDRGRTYHAFAADDGSLGGVPLFGTCEHRDDCGLRKIGKFHFRR